MNLEKLSQAVSVSTDTELDRMIALHQDEVTKRETAIKKYLLSIANGGSPTYAISVDAVSAGVLSYHKGAVEYLKALKEELA